jgi:hypothetical protein
MFYNKFFTPSIIVLEWVTFQFSQYKYSWGRVGETLEKKSETKKNWGTSTSLSFLFCVRKKKEPGTKGVNWTTHTHTIARLYPLQPPYPTLPLLPARWTKGDSLFKWARKRKTKQRHQKTPFFIFLYPPSPFSWKIFFFLYILYFVCWGIELDDEQRQWRERMCVSDKRNPEKKKSFTWKIF